MAYPYKLLVGRVRQAGWCGNVHPNNTLPWDSFATVEQCNDTATGKVGCLFDVVQDPGGHDDLALAMPEKARELLAKMEAAQQTWFDPFRGTPDAAACEVAARTGFWGPFVDSATSN